MSIPFRIIFNLLLVNITVNFYNQGKGMTIKVNNISVNHLLSTKVKSFQFISPQLIPENLFSRRHAAPHFSCTLVQFSWNLLSNDNIFYWHILFPFPRREGARG